MERDRLPPYPSASYVVARWKAVYISVPKAACTSLKWLVADLQGEDRERFHRSLSREVARAMCIHRRALWRHTPRLRDLSDDDLAAIDPHGDWLVFAVVRHPSARLFSAWQSKFLLREPRWVDMFGDASWFPRLPRSTEDIVEDFGRFALSLAEHPEQAVLRDRHFVTQRRLLRPDRVPYTRIYDTPDIPTLLTDLERHLTAQGRPGSLELAAINETPLRPLPDVFPPNVADAIRKVYAEDFETFGYEDVLPPKLAKDAYPPSVLAEIARLVERAERIGDLATQAQGMRRAEIERRSALVPGTRSASPRSLRAALDRARKRLREGRRRA